MTKDLALPQFTNRGTIMAQNEFARYSGTRELTEIFKEGARQLAAQEMQAAKTVQAINLTTQVYQHALQTADSFKREAYERFGQTTRSQEHQEDYQALHQSLMNRYNSHLQGIVEIGVTNIARELHRDVLSARPDKKGWFR